MQQFTQKFLFEQGVGGIVQFPKTLLKKTYELVRKNGGVCIADEVFTCSCRVC
jgi:4-aminobutyrate aminotransferase-like enzyme